MISFLKLIATILILIIVFSIIIGKSAYKGAAAITSTLSDFGPGGMFGGIILIIIITAISACLIV